MRSQALSSLFRAIVPTGLTAVLITSVALPMPAQSSVPASAVQAAKMPQYASRLARPTSQSAVPPNPARRGSRNGMGQGTIYDNGPINGTTDAWEFNFGFVVSDSFTIANNGDAVTGMSFGVWLLPGDILQGAEISITSEPNSGTAYFDQTVSLTQAGCVSNQFGFNVCTITGSFSPTLNAGTYWVNLQNAVVNDGNPVYWDENSGEGCTSPGCPSQASDNQYGTIPSESFTVLGNASTTGSTPEPDTIVLFGSGVLAVATTLRRRSR